MEISCQFDPHAGRYEDFLFEEVRFLAISKERKEELLEQYEALLDQSDAIFLTEYTGLRVKQVEALRRRTREAGGAFHITKNTLLIRALEGKGLPAPADLLVGQVATGFALKDAPAVAKVFMDFAKEEQKMVIRGGVMGNRALSRDDVEALAKLPPLEVIRAQFLGILSAPAQGIASALANGVRQVMNVLDAYAKKDEANAPAESPA